MLLQKNTQSTDSNKPDVYGKMAASLKQTKPRLFSRFEGLDGKIAWTPLANLPTPVLRLDNVSAQAGAEIWIKRDDLTSHVYGGNKVRKLEFVLGDALLRKKKTLVTMGGLGSNHGLATAIFGDQLGFDVVLKLMAQPINEYVLKNLRLFAAFRAQIDYCPTMARLAWEYFIIARLRYKSAYFVPAGGSSPLGVLGYVNAGLEIAKAINNKEMPLPEKIFVAAGTCGTMAGLALGLALAEISTTVVGVKVAPASVANEKKAVRLAEKTLDLLRGHDPAIPKITLGPDLIYMDTTYFGKGYGHETKKGKKAISIIKESEGLDLEPTYTGKAFAAVLDHAKFTKGPVLFINTFNSVDFSDKAQAVDIKSLPEDVSRFFDLKGELN